MQLSNRYVVVQVRNTWRVMQGDLVLSSFKQMPFDPPGRAEEFARGLAAKWNTEE